MSGDRTIRLDVSVPDLGARARQGERAPGREQPQANADDRRRFEQSLGGQMNGQPRSGGQAEGEAAQRGPLPSPLDLFGNARPAPLAPEPAPAEPAFDAARLGQALSGLMVGDGRSGGQQVRMELKDDLLPGVTVVIEQVQGRLQVDFICSVEASRLKLNEGLPAQAPQLAQQLRRDVLLRVQTDDDEDLRLFEVAASA